LDTRPIVSARLVGKPAALPALRIAASGSFFRAAARCRLHGLKKSGMRRLAEHGATTHELMAISGHKTLSEVQRYTTAADKKRLAASGMAKRQAQSVNTAVSNLAAEVSNRQPSD
jgi:hypothetical protein